MIEKSPTPPTSEHEEYERDQQLGEVAKQQMSDIIDAFGFWSEVGTLDEEKSLELAEWAKGGEENLTEALVELDYPPEALDKAALSRLKLCLVTPRFVYQQLEKDRLGKSTASMRRGFAEYGEILREAVHENTDIPHNSLIHSLGGVVVETGMLEESEAFEDDYEKVIRIFEGATNGAATELVMEQLAQSEAAVEAGIVYKRTSVDDDLTGVDMSVFVPVQDVNGRAIHVRVNLDVKSSTLSFSKEASDEDRGRKYQIDEDRDRNWYRVIMTPEVSWTEMNNRMTLDEAGIKKREHEMVQQLQEVAGKILTRAFIARGMAETVLKARWPALQQP